MIARARGAALVAAMLVAAIAAAVVATLASTQAQWLRNVELRRDSVQSQALVLAGLAWTRQVIAIDARQNAIDHLGEPWAMPLPATPLENGSIEGNIVDVQGRLNLNNLASDGVVGRGERARLARVFARAAIPVSAIDALQKFIAGDGAPLVRSAEATLVRGIDEARFANVAEFVTALPTSTPLNVNTAAAEVLASAVNGLEGDALAALLADRARRPFASVAEFRSRLPAGASIDNDATISVKSDYFLVTVVARQRETIAHGRALLRRGNDGVPSVVWQTIE
ncbi:MAG TPA: type II secretion system minor pseudopilin GspK [Casimicrobiaceae bacterium]|nr:type II secretion system minor pseudopilin GspK [Casimicrobiaceae bacterium]